MAALTATGCGTRAARVSAPSSVAAAIAIDLGRSRPLGHGPAFRPAALGNPLVAAGAPVDGLRCGAAGARPYGVHIELFAHNRGIAVPAGIGIAEPQRRQGAVVTGGRCMYPVRTTEPTGVVEVDPLALSGIATVGQLFRLWGQPLSGRRLVGFTVGGGAGVVAFVDGRRWHRDPRAVPLRRHAQIVLELGAFVAPHPLYTFPPGL